MVNRRLLRTKILRSLYSHTVSSRAGAEVSLAEYKKSVHQSYLLQLLVLQLFVEVRNYTAERQKIAAAKLQPTAEDLNPKTRLLKNPIIRNIEQNESLQSELREAGLSWRNHNEVVREIHKQITTSDRYYSYEDGTGSERDFVAYVLRELLEDNTVLESAIEDMSILWADDLGYALSEALFVVDRHLEKERLLIYKNDDDREYGEKLFMHAAAHCGEYLEMLEELSEKWELDRIAYMDKLLFVVATAELVSCPTIPIKATLNEYIEISKYYSTPSSYNFINGVLFKVIDRYTQEGKIQKSGRGLVDTKRI